MLVESLADIVLAVVEVEIRSESETVEKQGETYSGGEVR